MIQTFETEKKKRNCFLKLIDNDRDKYHNQDGHYWDDE